MKFQPGDKVRKISGGKWRGTVVGTYSTELNPEGYAVESSAEVGSVQIYPAKALEAWDGEAEGYTAVDMATARAEGYRDGQAAVTAERDRLRALVGTLRATLDDARPFVIAARESASGFNFTHTQGLAERIDAALAAKES